ncbi:Sodium/calcium exchanger membrane region [Kalmanozyma brasiliensis GHG001]|uniref:Sodium/calcium exchanger membrane region domain-containing protein n=1 Tax=Kalmanozyma brasiliensis (strain GHG001) TaxID=1365824 RepID=V5EZT4_KALBG|nr:Sodium/calcium exchanger membrane region [Kalmanozyma brasiliensis GHG001]EST08424.1 Sodium/calcium exchanger membrane region [Kalmanozyma brasiliensis GHG001]
MVAIGSPERVTDPAQPPLQPDSRKGDLIYSSSVFVAGLLLLEKAADGFIRQVSQLSAQLGISPTLIALLTAGAEWEELVVVVASIAHGSSNLAIANVVGSAISNILGAFSLGILFAPDAVKFDDSSKRFAIIQAAITSLVLLLVGAVQIQHADKDAKLSSKRLFENVVGVSFIVIFVLYFVGLSWAISRGMLAAPQGSDSESSSTSSDDDNRSLSSQGNDRSAPISSAASTTTLGNDSDGSSFVPPRRTPGAAGRRGQNRTATSAAIERTPLLLGSATSSNLATRLAQRRRAAIFRSLRKLLLSFLLLSLAGYLLSHSILEIASLVHLSDTVLGLTVLSFATTIPEKFLSVMAGLRTAAPSTRPAAIRRPSLARRASVHDEAEDDVARGASSILMAGAAGSNIFLLTLCLGVSLIFDHDRVSVPASIATLPDQHRFAASSVQWQEFVLLEVASLSLVLIAFTGGQRWQGALLLLGYFAFLIAEFTVLKR